VLACLIRRASLQSSLTRWSYETERAKKKPTWQNTLRYSTTSAYS
jgi:hypothetical protein